MPKKLFKPGKSGNPKGRPRGSVSKATAFREALASEGLTPELMVARVFHQSLAAGDYQTAQKAAADALKYCYAPPATEATTAEGASAATVRVVFDKPNAD